MLFGTDSHTCNAGAFGQFASGVGNTDAGFILGTGKLLIKVPQTLRFVLDGQMPSYLMAKDVILHIIGEIGVAGPPPPPPPPLLSAEPPSTPLFSPLISYFILSFIARSSCAQLRFKRPPLAKGGLHLESAGLASRLHAVFCHPSQRPANIYTCRCYLQEYGILWGGNRGNDYGGKNDDLQHGSGSWREERYICSCSQNRNLADQYALM